MADKQFARLEELFTAALELSAGQRQKILDQADGLGPELRGELESLLAHHDRACEYFDQLENRVRASSSRELEVAGREDLRIGPYRTLRLLGQGGMGAVYLSERVDGQFEQQVALKLIRSGMESEAATTRFLAERQILARLNHPNIAGLLDGGVTDEGQPYFVLEYVEGDPLLDYCDSVCLSIEKRLKIFLAVCEAVRYAHQSLVVHRDLKPSNILVDREGRVRLLDFGIAKLLQTEDTAAESGATLTQFKPLTLPYAAPEQLLGEPATTATDTYALGLILYELLCGRRGQDTSSSNLRELERVILNVDPVPPSERAGSPSTGELSPSPTEIAGFRGLRAEQLRRKLQGDLNNICLMALEKEPMRRYRSVESLMEDVQRYLHGHTITARKQTLVYRTCKFAQRHHWGVIAAVAVLALIAIAFVRERGLRGGAERARVEAQAEAAKAVAVSHFLTDLLSSVDPRNAQGREVTVADVLDQAAEGLDGEHALRDQPLVEAAVRRTLGDTYRALGKPAQARTHLEQAVTLLVAEKGERDPGTLEVMASLGVVHSDQGFYDEAELILNRVVDLRTDLLGEEHPDTLSSMNQLAGVYWRQGRYEELERLDRKTLAVRRRVLGEEHIDTIRSMNGLAVTLYSTARYSEAAGILQQALAIQQRLLGPDHPDTLQLGNNLAAAYSELGRNRDAEPLLRDVLQARLRVLGEGHEDTAMSMHNLAAALRGLSRYQEAETLLKRAISIRERKDVGDRTRLLESKSHLADTYRDQRRLGAAEALYLDTLDEQRRTKGPEDAGTLKTERGLAELRLRQGQVTEAGTLITRVLEAQSRVLGAEHPNVLESTTTLARVRMAEKRFADAEELSRKATEAFRPTLGESHPLVLDAAFQEVLALCARQRWQAAENLALEIYTARASKLGEEHPDTVEASQQLIHIQNQRGTGAKGRKSAGNGGTREGGWT